MMRVPVQMIGVGDSVAESHVHSNTFRPELKRIGCGEPVSMKLSEDVAGTCSDPGYYFRWVPLLSSFSYLQTKTVEVVGGIGPFSWSIEGLHFTLGSITTSGRENTVSTDALVAICASATISVEDSCGNIVTGGVKACPADRWLQKADTPFIPSWGGIAVTVGDLIYSGLGVYTGGSWWAYNSKIQLWTQKADFPVSGNTPHAVAATLGSNIYVGLGGYSYNKFWYEYNTLTDTWTRKGDFPGSYRSQGVAIGVGGKVYVGTGTAYYNLDDWWEYNTLEDSWTQKGDFPGGLSTSMVAVELNDKAYVGLSGGGLGWWEYNPIGDQWTQKADFHLDIPFQRALSAGVGAAADGLVYFGTGRWSFNYSTLWGSYNPVTNAWQSEVDFPGSRRNLAVAAAVNNTIYMGRGYSDDGSGALNDWWEYLT